MNNDTYESLNSAMSGVMEKMQSFVVANEKLALPQPSVEFTAMKQLLDKGEMTLVVCGKVKNGKSSLINAIIGRELLPVASNVATSQVFKLFHSDVDTFSVVYVNGDRKPITKEQLSSYGSQDTINKDGLMDADKSVAYIEIGTKIDFLPKGISILDTPGIGATYPRHTGITKQCIKMADAALFVLNPSPLETIELDFLKEVAAITPNIMFVMTKVDNENMETAVSENLKRNAEQINKAIGDRLYRGVNILTMSSTILMDAAQSDDKEVSDFNMNVSGYQAVKEEMSNLVNLTKGFYRISEAFNYSLKYYNNVLQNLENRLQIAKANGQKAIEINRQIDEARQRLNNFGKVHQQEIMVEIDTRLKAFDLTFRQKMQPHGPVVEKFYDEIDKLDDKGLEAYANDLGEKLIADLRHEWEQLQYTLTQGISSLLVSYSETLGLSPDGTKGVIPFNVDEISDLEKVTFRKRAYNARNEAMIGIGGLTIASYLGATTIPIVGPIIVLGALGYTIYGLFAGNTRAKKETLEANKRKLKQFVSSTVADFFKVYTEVSLENGQYNSVIDGYKLSVRSYAQKTLSTVYDGFAQQVKALEEIRDGNKAESITLLNGIIEKWNANKAPLQEIRNQLEKLNSDIK